MDILTRLHRLPVGKFHYKLLILVGLTYGYNYNVPIKQSNPTFVTGEFSDILKFVE